MSLDEILWSLPYKRLLELINTRQERLINEEKALAEQNDLMERENLRNRIVNP